MKPLTILEGLKEAERIMGIGMPNTGKELLHWCLILMGKGYPLSTDMIPLMDKYEKVELVPPYFDMPHFMFRDLIRDPLKAIDVILGQAAEEEKPRMSDTKKKYDSIWMGMDVWDALVRALGEGCKQPIGDIFGMKVVVNSFMPSNCVMLKNGEKIVHYYIIGDLIEPAHPVPGS